jgi:putative chitinase
MIFDREKFFAGWHHNFGSLHQEQVDGLNTVLPLIEADSDLSDIRWVAYILATIHHETAEEFRPNEEHGAIRYFDKYEPGTHLGRVLGNIHRGDGNRYKGRGYVQPTGRWNYLKLTRAWNDKHPEEQVSFIDNPEILLVPKYSWFATSYAMRTGSTRVTGSQTTSTRGSVAMQRPGRSSTGSTAHR